MCYIRFFFIFISSKSILGVGTTELYFFGRFLENGEKLCVLMSCDLNFKIEKSNYIARL